jgi:hypothetical protein
MAEGVFDVGLLVRSRLECLLHIYHVLHVVELLLRQVRLQLIVLQLRLHLLVDQELVLQSRVLLTLPRSLQQALVDSRLHPILVNSRLSWISQRKAGTHQNGGDA